MLVHSLSFPGWAGQVARSDPRARWRQVCESAHLHSPRSSSGRPAGDWAPRSQQLDEPFSEALGRPAAQAPADNDRELVTAHPHEIGAVDRPVPRRRRARCDFDAEPVPNGHRLQPPVHISTGRPGFSPRTPLFHSYINIFYTNPSRSHIPIRGKPDVDRRRLRGVSADGRATVRCGQSSSLGRQRGGHRRNGPRRWGDERGRSAAGTNARRSLLALTLVGAA